MPCSARDRQLFPGVTSLLSELTGGMFRCRRGLGRALFRGGRGPGLQHHLRGQVWRVHCWDHRRPPGVLLIDTVRFENYNVQATETCHVNGGRQVPRKPGLQGSWGKAGCKSAGSWGREVGRTRRGSPSWPS